MDQFPTHTPEQIQVLTPIRNETAKLTVWADSWKFSMKDEQSIGALLELATELDNYALRHLKKDRIEVAKRLEDAPEWQKEDLESLVKVHDRLIELMERTLSQHGSGSAA